MANIKDGYDDLGYKVLTRSQLVERLNELNGTACPTSFGINPADPDSFGLINQIYEEGVRALKHRKPVENIERSYAVTLTTQVTNGVPRKGYFAFQAVLERILEFPGVTRINGNFEITQQNALHVHCIVTTSKYLDSGKVRRANGNEHVVLQLLKNEKHKTGTQRYITKDEDSPQCLAVIQREAPHITTTQIHMQ